MCPKDIMEETANEEQVLFEKIEMTLKLDLQITGYTIDIKNDISLEKSVNILKIQINEESDLDCLFIFYLSWNQKHLTIWPANLNCEIA